jgi:hypothetical protein
MKTPELLRAKIMIDQIIRNKAFIEAEQLYGINRIRFNECSGQYIGDIYLSSLGLTEFPKFLKYITSIHGDLMFDGNQLTSLLALKHINGIYGSVWCDNNKTIFSEKYVRFIIKNIKGSVIT